MKLYAIGDFHLSLSGEKPMNIFSDVWDHHEDKLRKSFETVTDEDITVICGDLSWETGTCNTLDDFKFVESLPGRKILLKGNHDYWWTTMRKMTSFFEENNICSIDILHNNFYEFGDYAICGTRGWFFEEEKGNAHDGKIMAREIGRLKTSLDSAGDRKKIVFLHYPPVYRNYRCDGILNLLKEHEVRLCCYGHLHGKGCAGSVNGWYEGTEFRLVSADFLNFKPIELHLL